jgi:hypothetical protein
VLLLLLLLLLLLPLLQSDPSLLLLLLLLLRDSLFIAEYPSFFPSNCSMQQMKTRKKQKRKRRVFALQTSGWIQAAAARRMRIGSAGICNDDVT